MKKLCIIILLIAGGFSANAQMEAILKTMLEEIAQLKVYLSLAEKGYSIAENGLHVIRDIKHGEFNLHSDYFSSLKQVKPAITGMDAVNATRALQAAVTSKAGTLLKTARSTAWLLPGELAYVASIVNAVVADCSKDGAALTALTTDGSLSMSDGDRVAVIEALYEDVQRQDMVLSGYAVQVNQLIARRSHDAGSLDYLKKIYGL